MTVAVYAIDGIATAITAQTSDRPRPATRRATSQAGTAASDIATAFVAFASA